MHVLVLTPSYPHAGNPAEGLFNREHVRALAAAGVRITVVVTRPWLPYAIARSWRRYRYLADLTRHDRQGEVEVLTVRYLHLPGYRLPSWTAAACAHSILGAAGGLAVDLVHAHSAWPAGVAAPAVADALGCPFVVTFHIDDPPGLARSRLYERMLRGAGALAAVGTPLADALCRRYPGLEVLRVPNGIAFETIRRATSGALAAEASEERPWGRLVSVANLWPVKGVDFNLKALARLASAGRPWQRYTVVGDGPERPRLESLARQLGIAERVDFRGRLRHEDALREIAAADVFSLPSWQEAFGVVYLEALACGKPAVGCRTQGAEDVIRHRIDGLLVEPRDVGRLAEALDRLLADESYARALGTAGPRRAAGFTWRKNAERYLEIYERLIWPASR